MNNWRRFGRIYVVQFLGLVMLSTACLAQPSISQLKSTAQRYYWGKDGTRDHAKALSLYLQAAALGDAEAQFIAGGMYFRGRGTEKDPKAAFRLLYQAALNGKSSPESQKILAQSFLVGQAVPKSYPEAVHWYQKSADNGDMDAQNELAFLYFVGHGVEQNPEKAFELFSQAAHSGLAIAQYNVGIMYYTGNGVAGVDLSKSYAWLNLAASNGYQDADAARIFLETVLDQGELAQAQKLSGDLFRQIEMGRGKEKSGK
jgi:uncharacterized protein